VILDCSIQLGDYAIWDTYFIGDNGAEIIVNQTAVYNGFIYAATNSGIRRAVTNKKFDRLQAMGNYSYRNWSSVLVFGADLYAINGAGSVHKFDSVSNTFVGFIVLPQSC
jgi:hypothetical protein